MSERRRLLDTAAFLDSAQALRISEAPTKDVREIAQRFFAACYEDLGTAPRLLEGEDQISLLRVHLPRRYSRHDPLAAATGSEGVALTVFGVNGVSAYARVEGRYAFPLPDEAAGTVMIFKTFGDISYALVMEATRAIHKYDHVRNPI